MMTSLIYKRLPYLIIAIGFLTWSPFQGFAQEEATGSIRGTIQDTTQKPVTNADVQIPSLDKGTVTGNNGKFRFSDIPVGEHNLLVSKIGYADRTREVTVEAGKANTVQIELKQGELTFESVTLTGTPVPRARLKTTADVELLAGDEKTESQQTSMGGSVEQMAGVNNISTGSQTGKPVIRGLSGPRIRMLHNNVAMDHQQYGVRHMPNMDPFLAQRIELVQGPSSVLYGSDAMGGVINFMTPGAPDMNNSEGVLRGNVLSSYRTNNNQLSSGVSLSGAKNGWGFEGAIIRRDAGNIQTPDATTFFDPEGEVGDPRFSGELDNTDFTQLNGRFSAGYNGDFGQVSVNYTRWSNEHNFLLPNSKGLGQRLQNDILQGQGRFHLGDSNTLVTKLTYSRNHRQSNRKGQPRNELPDPDEEAHLDILRELYSGRMALQHRPIGPLEGQVGIEVRQTNQTTQGVNEPLVPSADILNIGAFLYEEIDLGDLTLTAGTRYDFMKQEAQANQALNLPDSGESNDVLTNNYQVFSGSIGANYRLTEDLAVSANAGRGFRAPSVFDLHVDGVHGGIAAYQKGDPNLAPETNLNTDLSIKWRSSDLKAKASVYRNAIDNYIFLINTGKTISSGDKEPPILRNFQGDAVLRGAYFRAEWQILNWLRIKGNYEMVEGESKGNDAPENVDELPLMPANNGGGSLQFSQKTLGPLADAFIRIGVRQTAAKDAAGRYEPFWQFDKAFSFGRASTDAYTLLNAGIGFAIPWQDSKISVSIQGQNLTDAAYRNFLDTYKGYALSPGRNITFKVHVPFTLIGADT